MDKIKTQLVLLKGERVRDRGKNKWKMRKSKMTQKGPSDYDGKKKKKKEQAK